MIGIAEPLHLDCLEEKILARHSRDLKQRKRTANGSSFALLRGGKLLMDAN